MADLAEGGIAGRPGESAEDALLHEILEEKYASLVGQIEVFNDLRRTDNYLDSRRQRAAPSRSGS